MGRPKIHATNSAKVSASRGRWNVTNEKTGVTNKRFEVWIPGTIEDQRKIQGFAAELRRNAGTATQEDLII